MDICLRTNHKLLRQLFLCLPMFAVTSAGLSYQCLEMEDGDSVALTIQDGTLTTIVVLS